VALVGLGREQGIHQPFDVGVELVHLAGGVAVAEEKEIHFDGRRSALEDGPHLAGGRQGGAVDEAVGGVGVRR